MNCWPSLSLRYCAIRRASMSVGPPAANPTTSRTGRVGYCANAVPQVESASAITPNARRRKLISSPLQEVARALQRDPGPVARRSALGCEHMRQLDAERNVFRQRREHGAQRQLALARHCARAEPELAE